MRPLIWGIVVLLLVLWAGGLALKLLGAAIHVLLVAAIVLVLWNLVICRT